MKIAQDRVVTLEYTLKNADGKLLGDTSGQPLHYLHGHRALLPALEQALEGREAGADLALSLSAEQAYGVHDPALILELPKSELPAELRLEKGARLQVTLAGKRRQATIVRVKVQTVVVDANHPLANQALTFSVKVKEVRRATREELEHGHAHGPGAHRH